MCTLPYKCFLFYDVAVFHFAELKPGEVEKLSALLKVDTLDMGCNVE